MTDTDKLKRLAEKMAGHTLFNSMTLNSTECQEYSQDILALIAENEQLKRRVASGSQSLKASRQIGVNAARNMSEALKERDEAVAKLKEAGLT